MAKGSKSALQKLAWPSRTSHCRLSSRIKERARTNAVQVSSMCINLAGVARVAGSSARRS